MRDFLITVRGESGGVPLLPLVTLTVHALSALAPPTNRLAPGSVVRALLLQAGDVHPNPGPKAVPFPQVWLEAEDRVLPARVLKTLSVAGVLRRITAVADLGQLSLTRSWRLSGRALGAYFRTGSQWTNSSQVKQHKIDLN